MRPPRALDDGHVLGRFACGVVKLDAWLAEQASRAQRAGTARTWVWAAPEDREVVAYYSLAPTQVRRDDVSRSFSGGVTVVPAYLIARLALSVTLHGQRLGSLLLLDALRTVVDASDAAGGRLVVVDAIDEAAARFYERHDFRRVGSTSRLVMKVATARQALDAGGS